MCGRYSLSSVDPAALRARFGLKESVDVPRRFNIAPGSPVLAVILDRHGERRAAHLRWGLVPGWAKDPGVGAKMINARSETLLERPAFRGALERFRCLVPADGFYEWQARAGERRKQPFHISRADGEPFAFAGLWSVWHRGGPDELRTVTIVTTAAGAEIASVHDRMPVILEPDTERTWLARETTIGELQGALQGIDPGALGLRAVGPAVNDASYDGPECLLDPPAATQGTLFA